MHPNEAQIGTRVRLVGAPERTGAIIAAPTQVNGRWYVQVRFDSGRANNTPLENLEKIPQDLDPWDEALHGNFSGSESLRMAILHEKLEGRLTDVIYSMEASDTKFMAYQFKPVIRILESPTNSLLIADEVGLGKTIETGLIWTELVAREGARTMLVVTPPHLIDKWRNELKRRFGVEASRADAATVLERLRDAERYDSQGFALLVSYYAIRPPDEGGQTPAAELARQLQQWGDGRPPFLDFLVMEEAAIMRNPESGISKLGELLAPIARHKVYLTATPVQTESKNLFTLLRTLDPDTFSGEVSFRDILLANEPLVQLRRLVLAGGATQPELLDFLDAAQKRLPALRQSHSVQELRNEIAAASDLTDAKTKSELAYFCDKANLLGYIVNRTRKKEVQDEHPVQREVKTLEVILSAAELGFYRRVTDAVREYATDRGITQGFLTIMPQRQVASCVPAAWGRLVRPGPLPPEERTESDLPPDQTWTSAQDRRGTPMGPLTTFIAERLAGLAARQCPEPDSKYDQLITYLRNYWQQNPRSKIVLFAYFKPTLHYLERRLRQDGFEGILLTGDTQRSKQDVLDDFKDKTNIKILLASDAGREGLDMQFASVLINYDLPWNPMIVEQRIGRIHRIGQEADRILIVNLICAGTVDERIYDRLYNRLQLFERTLGDLDAVIGPVINELTKDLLSHRLTPEQEATRIDEAAVALENTMKLEEDLEEKASVLSAYGDYLINQIRSAHQRGDWIHGGDLEAYVTGFFRQFFPATRMQGLDPNLRKFRIDLDPAVLHEFETFLGAHRLQGLTRLSAPGARSIMFDHRVYKSRTAPADVEVIHQAHPLVRFVSHHLRTNRLMEPAAAAVQVPRGRRPERMARGTYAFLCQRWKVHGMRPYDRLYYDAVSLETGEPLAEETDARSLVEIAAAVGEPAPILGPQVERITAGLADVRQTLEDRALTAFDTFLRRCERENEDRQAIQVRGVDNFEQRRTEVLRAVLAGHRGAGRTGLVAATEGQLDALRRKCEQQRHKIASSRTISEGPATVALGFIILL